VSVSKSLSRRTLFWEGFAVKACILTGHYCWGVPLRIARGSPSTVLDVAPFGYLASLVPTQHPQLLHIPVSEYQPLARTCGPFPQYVRCT
jgi:hypothetical protein